MTAGPTPPFFVITGGPGSGKTTLIEALAATGLATAAEAGRQIIIEERQSSGRALPWVDPRAFAEAMLVRDVDSYAAWRDATGPVFFDRGIPDVIGYLRLESVLVPPAVLHAARAHRYREPVFICPPWPEIYTADNERKQSFDVAEPTYRAMVEVYSEFGYGLVEVPRQDIEARIRFVQQTARDAMNLIA
jgi:predicted ATPase